MELLLTVWPWSVLWGHLPGSSQALGLAVEEQMVPVFLDPFAGETLFPSADLHQGEFHCSEGLGCWGTPTYAHTGLPLSPKYGGL